MSNIENLNVSVQGQNPEKPVIIHLLEGKAPEPVETIQPKQIGISGDINTPVNFSQGMNPETKYDPMDAIVEFSDNPKDPWIEIKYEVGKSLFHRVRGELKPNPDLAKFHFNEAGFFTNKTFAEMIMNHPHCFANKGEAKSLRKSLQNYQAKFNTLVKKADDNQGNTEDMIKTEFDRTGSGIPPVINLKMPLFDGGDDKEFSAEVEIEVVMTSGKPEARFAFFTEELGLTQRESAKKVIQEQINQLKEHFTCIRVNQ